MNAHEEYALTVWLSDQMLALHTQKYDKMNGEDDMYIQGMMDAYQQVFNKIIHSKRDQQPTIIVRDGWLDK